MQFGVRWAGVAATTEWLNVVGTCAMLIQPLSGLAFRENPPPQVSPVAIHIQALRAWPTRECKRAAEPRQRGKPLSVQASVDRQRGKPLPGHGSVDRQRGKPLVVGASVDRQRGKSLSVGASVDRQRGKPLSVPGSVGRRKDNRPSNKNICPDKIFDKNTGIEFHNVVNLSANH